MTSAVPARAGRSLRADFLPGERAKNGLRSRSSVIRTHGRFVRVPAVTEAAG